MNEVKQKRPDGITAISILWFLAGIYNAYNSFQILSQGVAALPYLSNSGLHAWFSFGVPTEMVLSGLVLALGLIQIITVFGLWTGKKYSYKLARTAPIILVILNVCSIGLYASAPAELGLITSVGASIVGLVVSIVGLAIIWWYLGKSHVKAFLGVAETAPPPPPTFREMPNPPREEMPKTENVFKVGGNIEARLASLKRLLDHNFISEEEYAKRKAEIFSQV